LHILKAVRVRLLAAWLFSHILEFTLFFLDDYFFADSREALIVYKIAFIWLYDPAHGLLPEHRDIFCQNSSYARLPRRLSMRKKSVLYYKHGCVMGGGREVRDD
jgi:hypothetical protein